MSSISSYFPGGTQSLSRQWMERRPSQKESLTTFITVGILSAAAGYYSERVYLISGATCFAISYGLKHEPKNAAHDPNNMAIGAPKEAPLPFGESPLPIRIMSFVVLSTFIGKCMRESWVKPTTLPNKAWKPYLGKAPFHYIAFMQVVGSLQEEVAMKVGKKIPQFINREPNDREILITAVSILTIFALVTYTVPGLNLLFGTVAISTFLGVGIGTASEKSDVMELLELGSNSLKLAMLIAIGGTIGSLTRSLIGPKNHSLPYSWPATLYLILHRINHFAAFALFAALTMLKGKEQELLDWVDRKVPMLDRYAEHYMGLIEKAFKSVQALKSDSVAGIGEKLQHRQEELNKLLEEFTPLRDLYLQRMLPEDSLPRFMELAAELDAAGLTTQLMLAVVQLCEAKNQSVGASVDELTNYFEAFKGFYEKVTGRAVVEYDPVDFRDVAYESQKDEVKTALQKRIGQVVRGDRELSKKQAAYILLAPYSKKKPDEPGDEAIQEANRKAQVVNYRKLARWFHPDKNRDSPESTEIFKQLGNANGALERNEEEPES